MIIELIFHTIVIFVIILLTETLCRIMDIGEKEKEGLIESNFIIFLAFEAVYWITTFIIKLGWYLINLILPF
jgi:hypothetical protein